MKKVVYISIYAAFLFVSFTLSGCSKDTDSKSAQSKTTPSAVKENAVDSSGSSPSIEDEITAIDNRKKALLDEEREIDGQEAMIISLGKKIKAQRDAVYMEMTRLDIERARLVAKKELMENADIISNGLAMISEEKPSQEKSKKAIRPVKEKAAPPPVAPKKTDEKRPEQKKPKGLHAEAVSSRQMDLSWDVLPDVEAVKYNVYRDGVFLKSVSGQSTSIVDHEPETSYCYGIAAVDRQGNESKNMQKICSKTPGVDGESPSAPKNLVAKVVSSRQIDLIWEPSTDNVGVKGYNIYQKGALIKSSGKVAASVLELMPDTLYCYVVTAYDGVKNESDHGEEACVKTLYEDIRRPTPPSDLTLSEVGRPESGANFIDLSWGASRDDKEVSDYNIYKDGVFLKAVSGTSAFKIDINTEETHCFMITAKDSSGNESRRSRQVCTTGRGGAKGGKSWGGTIWTGGINDYGQLGNGTKEPKVTLVMISGMQGFVRVASGIEHMVAVKSDGTVWAWGRNYHGQLGDGTNTDRLSPVKVEGLFDIIDIAAGMYHSIALRKDGTVWAWGRNYHGQLGDDTLRDRKSPIKVEGLNNVVSIAAGWYHTVAARTDGSVWAWGWNLRGQLGSGNLEDRKKPNRVKISDVEFVAAGEEHSVALKSDGTVWTWGRNNRGQLGNGGALDSDIPVQVKNISGVELVAAGSGHTAVLLTDGTVWGWGGNEHGQLGRTKGVKYNEPVMVEGINRVKAIAAGSYHTLGLGFDGTVWAWGWRMGERYVEQEAVPSRISGLSGVVDVAAGRRTSAAIRGE